MTRKRVTVGEVKKRIYAIHKDDITLDESTYINISTKCLFIDIIHGEWWTTPNNILNGQGHKNRKKDKIKKTCLIRFGVEHPSQSEEVMDKIKQTCLERFGSECSLGNKEVREKVTQTILSKYGVKNAMQAKEVNDRAKQTCLVRYGVEHPSQNLEIYERSKKSTFNHFGVEFCFQDKNVRLKFEETCLERYGVRNALQNKDISEKRTQTMLSRYGVKHQSQIPSVALQIAHTTNNPSTLTHWKSNKDLYCQGGYETKVVNMWNVKKENFDWQITFNIPEDVPLIGGKTYRVDAYLPDRDLYIEIKGWFRNPVSKLKWEWFHETYPNSELWDKKKLQSLGLKIL